MARVRKDIRIKSADLDREAVLLEPGDSGAEDRFGQPVAAAPVRHAARVGKMDMGGREAIEQDVDVRTLRTRFYIDYRSFPNLAADWAIEYDGQVYEISAPPTELGRRAFWEVLATRRKGGQ